jgi:hypothetical protein
VLDQDKFVEITFPSADDEICRQTCLQASDLRTYLKIVKATETFRPNVSKHPNYFRIDQ